MNSKEVLLLVLGILILLVISVSSLIIIFQNSWINILRLEDNSNPQLEENVENFLKAISIEDRDSLNELTNYAGYRSSTAVDQFIPFWSKLYLGNQNQVNEFKLIQCYAGRLGYNNIGKIDGRIVGKKAKCSDNNVRVCSILGCGISSDYFVEYELNGETFYIEYHKDFSLNPIIINPSSDFIKNIDPIPSVYISNSNQLPYNTSDKTEYVNSGNDPIMHRQIKLASLEVSECNVFDNTNETESFGTTMRDKCIEKIAVITGNLDTCKLINGDQSDCYRNFAWFHHDIRACLPLLVEEKERYSGPPSHPFTDCVRATINNKITQEGCALLSNTVIGFNYFANGCYSSLAMETQNKSYCDFIIYDPDEKEYCLSNFDPKIIGENCIDEDGGENLKVQSRTYGLLNPEGGKTSLKDRCVGGKEIKEYYCEEDEKSIGIKYTYCDNECLDGACL